MKQAYVYKSAGIATEEQLKMIERYCRRPMAQEEVYIFSLVLCDNEIDRDNERFTENALHKLGEMFLGKTGIFDHNPKGANQTARIFSTRVEKDNEKLTSYGESYCCLKAEAYMVRCPKNEDLILEIDGGIKKEVSVGCSVASITCSVCGNNLREGKCRHTLGKKYNVDGKNVVCCAVLDCPTDAYEWSFVAVPAQPAAGVTKSFAAGDEEAYMQEDIIKMLDCDGEIRLSSSQCKLLKSRLEGLEKDSALGREYLQELRQEVVSLGVVAQPALSSEILSKAIDRLDLEELKAMKKALLADRQQELELQLAPKGDTPKVQVNSHFKI